MGDKRVLQFEGAPCSGNVHSTEVEAARGFWDGVLGSTGHTPRVTVGKGQCLPRADPIDNRSKWDVGLSVQDPEFFQAQANAYRTREEMLGASLSRNA